MALVGDVGHGPWHMGPHDCPISSQGIAFRVIGFDMTKPMLLRGVGVGINIADKGSNL